jgi:hypothetical protein
MDEDQWQAGGDAPSLRTASMTTLCRRKRGDTLDTDSSETESDSSLEPSVKRLRFGDHRSSSSRSFHGQSKSLYDRECAECAIASAFMETIQTHLKNNEDNQKKVISLLEKLVKKA